jgi:peptidoglycan-N-acetylglucosamine deacetylase
MPDVFVSTSWDDEHRTGLRIAELLSRNGLRGTFYVPTGQLGCDSFFSRSDLRSLSGSGFEIGAHTISHAILPETSAQQRDREITECKLVLEQILGSEVTMFCYPKGRFNQDIVRAVQRAGYLGARGTQMLSSSTAFGRYSMPITLQAYPHRRSNYVRNLVRSRAGRALLKSIPDLWSFENWLELGKARFERVLREGGVWHLFGHSWEIEKLGLWSQLDEIFGYVANRRGVHYVTNVELLKLLKGESPVPNDATATASRARIN